MNIVELLSDLAAQQITLWLEADQLRYRAPKDALTPQIIGILKQNKPEIIAWLGERAQYEQGALQDFPIAQGQLGLWLDWQVDPRSTRYLLSTVYRLPNDVDMDALRRAAQAVLDRHPVLRTTYPVLPGETIPVQRIHPSQTVTFDIIDATTWTPSAVDSWIQSESERPFDLIHGPVTRFSVLRKADEALLVWTIHHIATDYTTQQILINELRAIYLQNSPPPTRPALMYHDFVRWERDVLRSRGDQDAAFWHEYLGDSIPTLDLPGRPAKGTPAGSKDVSFELDHGLVDKLRAVARAHRVTLNAVVLSAYELLIHRYTQQEKFLLSTPVSLRVLPTLASAVGYFVNLLYLRADFEGISSFSDLLRRTHDHYIRISDHQTHPFSEALRHLKKHARQDEIHEGVLGYIFVSLRQKVSDMAPFELRASRQAGRPQALTLTIFEYPDEVRGFVTYEAGRFDAGSIERMVGHLQTLLTQIATDPAQSIRTIPLLSPAERKQILVDWNRTESEFPKDLILPRRFEELAAQNPHQVALIFEDHQLTYGELNARANQLAHRLRALGVGPEVAVVLYVEKSIELIVGMLGVLKAGGAYLTIDSEYPRDRIAFVLDDFAPPVILTQSQIAERLPESGATTLRLDDWATFAQESTDNPPHVNVSTNIASVIYTSGSTGKPKGAGILHRNIARLLFGIDYVKLSPRSVVLFTSSISFDASTFDVWAPLLHGGTCVIYPERIPTGYGMQQIVERHRVDTVLLTTALFNAIIDDDPRQLEGLKQILIGGEALSPAHMVRAFEQLPNTALINCYGPAESTTLTSTHHYLSVAECQTVTIGRPLSNTQCYILDPYLNPVPPGIVGELYIGGEGLARGYLRRPGLTAQKFVANPFSVEPGATMYRTGDMARYFPDGTIDFLGRVDHQVKIRGFRIELGEVEFVLASHSDVAMAVVLARQDVPGEKRLVAYVVPKNGGALRESTLREYVATKLPEFMVPSRIIILSAFPLTTNGKIDRKALPAPDAMVAQSPTNLERSWTHTERKLGEIFCAVLGVPQIQLDDDFFRLGGHSLLAMQIASRIRQTWSIQLPIRALFENSTIATLARHVDQAERIQGGFAIPRADRSKPLALSFAQERLWFLDRLGSARCVYNMPAALRLRGELNVEALEKSLQTIVSRHESLRTRFSIEHGQPIQCVDSDTLVLSRIDVRGQALQEQRQTIAKILQSEVHHIFDLATGPLLRVVIVQCAELDHLLVFNTHHIIFDGWSMKVLYRELAELYAAFSRGQTSSLSALSVQYADFAEWQRRKFSEGGMRGQLEYWKQRLASAPELLALPTDRPRPPVQTHAGAHYFFRLPEPVVTSLRALCASTQTTMFMTCLAAWYILLARYTGQTDIVLGSPIANRNHPALEPLIGFFVNNIALRCDLSGEPTFFELLERVKTTSLDAYRHQDLPFGKLVEVLRPERNLSHSPIFQVLFDLFDRTSVDIEMPGLVVERLDDQIEFPYAKFDLTLSMLDGADADLCGRIEYNTDLFNRSTIARMAKHYERLLDAIVHDPRQSVRTLPMLDDDERRQILAECAPIAEPAPTEACFFQLFEEQAARTPDALAICHDDCRPDATIIRLTYRELNERANRLARHLHEMGVRAETRVGIGLERSPDLIISLLAIWKAGGAYVPFDPAYPADRLAFMFADSEVSVLLTERKFEATWPSTIATRIYLDELSLDAFSSANLDVAVSPSDAAYMIYTSGSTGKPKGVIVEHRSLRHTSDAQVEILRLEPHDRHLLFFSASFDGGLADVILPLRVGASLYLAPPQEILPGPSLVRFLEKHAISKAIFTPSALAQLPEAELPALHTIMTAGEACFPELVQRWGTNRRFLNLYGVTEGTIWSTAAVCNPDGHPPTIGRPARANQVYILDEYLQPVPIGVTGEIFLGGPGIARHYHRRPEMTKLRFLPNPFANGRLYRTGDRGRLVRRRDDEPAEIEFLGRMDNQVKLRGFRIELDEIEFVLRQHPDVRDAVVIVRAQRLIAYAVTKSNAAALRSFLQAELPDYMIPASIELLDALPLNAHGKVDRQALPDPQRQERFVAPQNALERRISALWCELLDLDKVGVHDNFFEVGGHSLLVVRLHNRLEKELGHSLPLTDLFKYPTIAALAARIDAGRAAFAEQDEPSGAPRQARRDFESLQRRRREQL